MWNIWRLIQLEAEGIAGYLDFLESDFAMREEAEPLTTTIRRIVDNKRDHLEALNHLYNSMTKNKPVASMTEFARQALVDYRERSKLIK